MAKRNQPALRLVKSEDLDLCSSYNFKAASPVGALVRPFSISLTDEGARPTSSPIASSVNPVVRKSEMREDHVAMRPSLRHAVDNSQRQPVTEFRNNYGMPRPPGLPKCTTIGQRVRWWREHRGVSRKDLAKAVSLGYSTLADLENDEQDTTSKLHLIAAQLRLNPHYLETDRGEPEAEFEQAGPPADDLWPFARIPRRRLEKLNRIERKYAEDRLLEVLAEIEAESKKTG